MKIGIYIPTASFFVGGGEIVPLMQAKYLAKRGNKIHVSVLKTSTQTEYFKTFQKENKNIKFDYLKMRLFGSDIPYDKRVVDHKLGHEMYFNLGREVSDYCTIQKFDVVITHYAPAAVSIPASTKQILVLHGVPETKEIVNGVAVRVVDKLVAVSKYVAGGWEKLYNTPRIEVIYNGIDSNLFTSEKTSKDIDILYVGRLIEVKGVQFLINAVWNLVKNYPDLRVVIGGNGPYEESLRKLTGKLSMEKNIRFIGYIPDNNLRRYYNRSKVVVLPSYSKEGVLTTLLEASSCECAVVTTNCCGMKEFVEDGENGLLVKPKSSKEIAEKIQYLLNNDSIRQKLGKNARREIERNWTWDKSIDRFKKLIKEVVNVNN
ncbi:hypothetical protein A3D00_04735 [Candidatus Woesebacteria bacterium RIFCSPHIGHO2_02_FULL_38_9]|uniref:Glycosyl transferase family 1 domain-containing protein n=1 Tax=Candidatus Woesebacteria bacterium RIFCSPHIGHO2_01_FULL_39_28 TaxID=1802496 RepID=A0A1F7YIM0_9BACT|nr:MAG: hypothetical protein A2627_04095 [Candidatus Woesebacteria bacterium RIFCSPHIGHO2_01_FULL_39_28]OGM34912.1 MAG: hypothetical protein A3D00_04735 [Candidatus Woesebacteria bacterium RIFCSPHIGHO2_02_FULL_38_9]OGM58677.1 MAG: hypothetical protein A3A50_02750 [Candidatus Woesebacteria bacterium RIFCSPLOWO2_01_FULL_38_20]